MSPLRKNVLVTKNVYHIYNRSIAKFIIFNNAEEYQRFFQLLDLCRYKKFTYKPSQFNDLTPISQKHIINNLKIESDLLIEVVAYCLMPTHIHLLLKQVANNGISKYMARILNGYSRYFNTKHNRVGPLWSGRFKNVLVSTNEQLLSLTRYIHLNPTSAGLLNKPEDWVYSSYHEYLGNETDNQICNFSKLLEIESKKYRKFVNDRKSYQRDISIMKSQLIDNYSG